MSKLYLRRIMMSSNRGDTTELSGEDRKKTFISLQGGKTFGRGEGNEVIFLGGSKTSEYISRYHAKIFHSIDGDLETYLIEDYSANGTYINDRRLEQSEKREIRSGDTIKFGHRNGSQIKPGERASHTDADFAFSVEGPPDEETCRLLEQRKTVKINVFSNSPITKEAPPRVQQEEADSTNGNAEDMNASSSKRGSASGSDCNHESPSTSQHTEDAPRDRDSWKFSDHSFRIFTLFIHNSCSNESFQNNFAELSFRLHALFPSIDLHTVTTLVSMCILDQASTREDYEKTIKKVSHILKDRSKLAAKVMDTYLVRLIDLLMGEEKIFKELCNTGEPSCDEGPNQPSDQNGASYDLNPSTTSAFLPPASPLDPPKQSCVVPLYPEPFKEDKRKKLLGIPQSFISFHYLTSLAIFPPSLYNELSVWKNFAALGLQKIPEGQETLPVAKEVPVIASLHSAVRTQSNGDVASSTSGGADEERHSSSYTSATNSRRRTESEDSEILDVVGGVSEFVVETPAVKPLPVFPDAEKPIAKPVAVAPVAEQLEIIPPADLSLTNGGTQTPSPVLQENEQTVEKKEVEAKKTIAAAAKALRKTTTPQSSDEQAGPSSTTAQSPVQSPLQILTPVDSVASSLNADTTSEDNSYDQKEEESPEKVGEEPKDDVQEKVRAEVATEETPKLSEKVDQVAVDEGRKEAEKVVTPAPKVPKVTDRRTKMKQLDDISNDSDSDEEQEKVQKKKVRRSTRTARASSPKKVPKEAEAEEMEAAEDDDEQPETPKNPGRGRNSRVAKSLKRTAVGPGRGRKAKSPVAGDEEEGAPPKKRRGRKKKQDDEEREEEAEAGQDPEKKKSGRVVEDPNPKNNCGVGNKFCFCAGYETKTNLHWVACNTCGQWYHVFCIRLSYHGFTDELFNCCSGADDETANAINGFHWASHVEGGLVFDRVTAEKIWAVDKKKEEDKKKKEEKEAAAPKGRAKGKN